MIDKMTEKEKIAYYMRTLECTEQEARDLIADDADVDKGIAKPWDLTKEQIKNQRKLANATTRKSSGTVKRTKKENPEKQRIITMLANSLENVTEIVISNPERAIDFVGSDGISYTVTLTAHRK